MEILVENLDALETETARFLATLSKGEHATLVTLSGELGAGKTAYTKALAKQLGIEEHVTSPTFVLEKIYPVRNLEDSGSNGANQLPRFTRLVHIDAYRLKDGSELAALGFDELMRDPSTVIILEWPEMVSDKLPVPASSITITANPDGSRTISYA